METELPSHADEAQQVFANREYELSTEQDISSGIQSHSPHKILLEEELHRDYVGA